MTALSGVTAGDDPGQTRHRARFGLFELDRQRAELRRGGVPVRLQDQPFRLLTYFVERAGEIVTREELREHLWPAEFVDFDHSLNTAIRKLRTALDDSADQPRYIETLARRGYRFIAPVAWEESVGQAILPVLPRETGQAGLPVLHRWGIAAALLAVIAIASFFVWRGGAASHEPIGAIAVLPFTNSDPRSEHVSDGLTELLIDKLSRLPDLRVMARGTVFDYKGKKIAPADAGKELHVGAVITGHLRREREQYAIHVELIDVRDGAQLWGGRYTAAPNELPLVQSRIADDLSTQLRRDADTEGHRFAARAYTTNAEAYEQYLLGLQLWHGREDLPRSVEHFNRAIALDPNFAAAWSGLANAYGVMAGNGLLPPEETTVKVLAAARKALALDPENAEAYTSIATTSFRSLWDFDNAERDYRRSLALNPNYATGHQWFSDYLRAMGRTEEARQEIDTALRLDPLSPAINSAKCHSLVQERRYEEALAFADRYERLHQRPMPHCVTSAAFALQDYDRLLAQPWPAREQIREAYRKNGPRALLELLLQWLLSQPDPESAAPVEIAETYALLGQPDKAFAWLEKGARHRSTRITSFHISPAFDSIRDDPRFAELAKRIGLPPAALREARALMERRQP